MVWSKTIMAWFDRWLKGEREWWDDLYPPREPPSATAEGEAEKPARGNEPEAIGVRIIGKEGGGTVILGEVTRNDIVLNIGGWDAEYFTYQPDESIASEISSYLDGVEIVVVLGTWCSDSRREVPRLWKVLERTSFLSSSLRMIAVESSRAVPAGALTRELLDWSKRVRDFYGIKAVESVIVYRSGVEIGRIVEAPAKSIEDDLLEILKR